MTDEYDDILVCDSDKSLLSSQTFNSDDNIFSVKKPKKSVRFSNKKQVILIPTRMEEKKIKKNVYFYNKIKVYPVPNREELLLKQKVFWYTPDEIIKFENEVLQACKKYFNIK